MSQLLIKIFKLKYIFFVAIVLVAVGPFFFYTSSVLSQSTGVSVNLGVCGQSVPINVTVSLVTTINKAEFDQNCSGSPAHYTWQVYSRLPSGSESVIKDGQQTLTSAPTQTYTETFNYSAGQIGSETITFFARTRCGFSGAQMTQSSNTPINPSCSRRDPVTGGIDQMLNWRITNPLVGNPQNVLEAVLLIVNWLANIAGSLVVIMIIYGGIKFLLSRGNPGEVGKAKTILTWALIGMAVVLIGKGFVFIIDSILRNQVPIP